MSEKEVVDQQWVATKSEAERIENLLAGVAATEGTVIGVKPGGGKDGGWLVTVEREIPDDEQ